ncbi:hypothetical protein [Pantoea dispersa]|uniref:hypothetical protein n=1 Tax=Pantoea dispersa TaxID=59814 RepID=UPI0024AFD8C4|nr:hypothetical protein [Pantoea dispersa]MDI6635036.1 hypothetical protein [Pantoea dispersa]
MSGRPVKEFEKYLTDGSNCHVSHDEYLKSPASAFLRHLVEAKDSIELCINSFPKKDDGSYSKASKDSLQYLLVATLPAIMGHFETYQRYLFAGIFDLSVHLRDFNTTTFFKDLEKETSINLDWNRMAAHRALGAGSVGALLADSIGQWHNPDKVNKYFRCFKLDFDIYSTIEKKRIKTLWQLRHSIAHTGGTLTLADAQKVDSLVGMGNMNIAFEKNFIFEVARKLHPLIKRSTDGLGNNFKNKLVSGLSTEDTLRIDNFFEVRSSVSVWLR